MTSAIDTAYDPVISSSARAVCPVAARLAEGREMYLQKALHRVRPLNGTSADYLRWFLQYAVSSGALEDLFTGSTIKHLPGRQLARIVVPTPPPRDQQRIADRLAEMMYVEGRSPTGWRRRARSLGASAVRYSVLSSQRWRA